MGRFSTPVVVGLALSMVASASCTEEFKPPPKKEAPKWGEVQAPAKPTVAALVDRLDSEYRAACARL